MPRLLGPPLILPSSAPLVQNSAKGFPGVGGYSAPWLAVAISPSPSNTFHIAHKHIRKTLPLPGCGLPFSTAPLNSIRHCRTNSWYVQVIKGGSMLRSIFFFFRNSRFFDSSDIYITYINIKWIIGDLLHV